MADRDTDERFDELSKKAQAAAEQAKAIGAEARERLEADTASAREKASEEASRLKARVSESQASSTPPSQSF